MLVKVNTTMDKKINLVNNHRAIYHSLHKEVEPGTIVTYKGFEYVGPVQFPMATIEVAGTEYKVSLFDLLPTLEMDFQKPGTIVKYCGFTTKEKEKDGVVRTIYRYRFSKI